ncbi:Synaptotagmin-7 [Balamuthia mandrillaris]
MTDKKHTKGEGQEELFVVVVAGRDLSIRDASGSSDPYVVLTVNGQHKQKTQVKKQTLNPSWNETFSFRLQNTAASQLLIQVMDWDRFSSDDFMGQVEIPLTEVTLKGQVDRWFDLSPKKASGSKKPVTGQIHLKLKWWAKFPSTASVAAPLHAQNSSTSLVVPSSASSPSTSPPSSFSRFPSAPSFPSSSPSASVPASPFASAPSLSPSLHAASPSPSSPSLAPPPSHLAAPASLSPPTRTIVPPPSPPPLPASFPQPQPHLQPQQQLYQQHQQQQQEEVYYGGGEQHPQQPQGEEEEYNYREVSPMWDFEAQNEGELSVRAGEVVLVVDDVSDPAWWLVRKTDGTHQEGYIPSNYFQST